MVALALTPLLNKCWQLNTSELTALCWATVIELANTIPVAKQKWPWGLTDQRPPEIKKNKKNFNPFRSHPRWHCCLMNDVCKKRQKNTFLCTFMLKSDIIFFMYVKLYHCVLVNFNQQCHGIQLSINPQHLAELSCDWFLSVSVVGRSGSKILSNGHFRWTLITTWQDDIQLSLHFQLGYPAKLQMYSGWPYQLSC